MARTRNEEEYTLKKQQILVDAISLLNEIGYEKFSINKVIESSGLTKGAFFHYYSSKKELIDGIVGLIMTPMIMVFNQIADNTSLNPKQRLLAMFGAATKMKTDQDELMGIIVNLLYKEENQTILHRVSDDMMKMNLPIYEKVIKEGMDLGYFDLVNAHGVAFMLLTNVIALNKELGKALYIDGSTSNDWSNLYDKLINFEAYARGIFSLEDDVSLYGDIVISRVKAQI